MTSKPTTITEIIPDDRPEWVDEAMAEGQLFTRLLSKLACTEALLPIWNSEMITQYDRGENLCGDKISDCMDDLKRALTGET